MTLDDLIKNLKPDAEVLDYGCFGWGLYARAKELGRNDLKHSGSDILKPRSIPDGAAFHDSRESDNSISCDSDRFDLVVASHVLEHALRPQLLFAELVRVCKPGGRIYIEAPSDRSVRPWSTPDPEDHSCLNFWDDPTHVRPWTPAALYRLAISYGCKPLKCAYMSSLWGAILYPFRRIIANINDSGDQMTDAVWSGCNWLCNAVIEKPADMAGRPEYRYISLKGVPRGAENALKLYRDLKGQ